MNTEELEKEHEAVKFRLAKLAYDIEFIGNQILGHEGILTNFDKIMYCDMLRKATFESRVEPSGLFDLHESLEAVMQCGRMVVDEWDIEPFEREYMEATVRVLDDVMKNPLGLDDEEVNDDKA